MERLRVSSRAREERLNSMSSDELIELTAQKYDFELRHVDRKLENHNLPPAKRARLTERRDDLRGRCRAEVTVILERRAAEAFERHSKQAAFAFHEAVHNPVSRIAAERGEIHWDEV